MELKFDVDDRSLPWPVGMDFVGQYSGTNFYCFHIISRVLKAYPKVSAIVEFGTFAGTLTMYLGLWGKRLGVPVHTFDIEPNVSKDVHHVFEALDIQTHWMDVFSKDAMRLVCDIFKEPGYLIVDGGDKQREFATYAPLLPIGQVFSIHDWTTEVHSLDGGIGQLYFEGNEWMAYDAMLATVVKIANAEDMTRQTTADDIKRINEKWIEVIGEGGN